MSTRCGGVSEGPYHSLNLGDHVDDDAGDVAQNRTLLFKTLQLPAAPVWLNQVHGTDIVQLPYSGTDTPKADGSFSCVAGQVCAVMTADCLPILLCDNQGTVVAAAHAGWRGLAAGVVENTVNAMAVAPENLMAWLGPAIGPDVFEVGPDLVDAFVEQDSETRHAFRQTSAHHWLADIYQLARYRLQKLGIQQVCGGGFCTYTDKERFYSYRRDKVTGRMAALIWLAA